MMGIFFVEIVNLATGKVKSETKGTLYEAKQYIYNNTRDGGRIDLYREAGSRDLVGTNNGYSVSIMF